MLNDMVRSELTSASTPLSISTAAIQEKEHDLAPAQNPTSPSFIDTDETNNETEAASTNKDNTDTSAIQKENECDTEFQANTAIPAERKGSIWI